MRESKSTPRATFKLRRRNASTPCDASLADQHAQISCLFTSTIVVTLHYACATHKLIRSGVPRRAWLSHRQADWRRRLLAVSHAALLLRHSFAASSTHPLPLCLTASFEPLTQQPSDTK